MSVNIALKTLQWANSSLIYAFFFKEAVDFEFHILSIDADCENCSCEEKLGIFHHLETIENDFHQE